MILLTSVILNKIVMQLAVVIFFVDSFSLSLSQLHTKNPTKISFI